MKKLSIFSLFVFVAASLIAQPSQKPSANGKATWKKNETGYWLYIDDVSQKSLTSVWIENDLLVYNYANTTTYLLPGYKTSVDDKIYDALEITKQNEFLWRTNGPSYWLYFNGESRAGTKSGWVEDDLLVYDSLSHSTLLLKGYKKAQINKVFAAEKLSTTQLHFWRTFNDKFWIYTKGSDLSGMEAFWFDDDMIAYYAPTKTTYRLKNYKTGVPNKVYPADTIASSSHVFWWQIADGTYWLYDKGKYVENVSSYWFGQDLVVYHPATNTTYKMIGYGFNKRKDLNHAEIVSTSDAAFWWTKDDSYWIYDKGVYLQNVESNYDGDNLLVKDTSTNTVYVLKNYKNATDNVMYPAVIRN